MSESFTVELLPGGIALNRGSLLRFVPLLTPAEARDLAASLVAAADAHDDEYGAT
jgi:hypothetical protein